MALDGADNYIDDDYLQTGPRQSINVTDVRRWGPANEQFFVWLRYPFYLKLLELELVYEWGCTHVRITPETYKEDLYRLVFE